MVDSEYTYQEDEKNSPSTTLTVDMELNTERFEEEIERIREEGVEIPTSIALESERPVLEDMFERYGDNLGVEDDFEYAIAVLLEYAVTDRLDSDIDQALDEIRDGIK